MSNEQPSRSDNQPSTSDTRPAMDITHSPNKDQSSSRRALLVSAGAAVTVGLTGCLGGGDDGDDGDDGANGDDGGDNGETPENLETEFDLAGDGGDSFREWVIPDNSISTDDEVDETGVELVLRYEDFELGDQQNWEPIQNVRHETSLALGVDAETIHGELIVGGPAEMGGDAPVIFGDFDAETIVDHFEDPGGRQQTGEYGEYTIFDNTAAVGSAAVLESPDYESYIDASESDGVRLEDEDEDVRLLFDLVPEGLETRVYRRHEEPGIVIEAQTNVEVDHDADQVRRVRTLVYEDEDAVDLDQARDLVSEVLNFEEILDEEHHDRVVMLEYLVNL